MRRTIVLATALLIAVSAYGETDTVRRSFNVGDGGTLRLDAGVGSIKVVVGGSGVAFEVTREGRGAGVERLRDHHIEFRQEGNDVAVTSDLEGVWKGWSRGDYYRVQWNIRVPARYNVDLRTSGGSIELGDIGGTVEARTSGGSISAGRLGGPASLRTSGGSISVNGARANIVAYSSGGSIGIGDTAGTVEARTSGGSISLARVGGEVTAKTSGGGITIEDAGGRVEASTSGGSIRARLSRQPAGESRLSTSGGSVVVELAGGVGVDLDARANGGGVSTDIPITVVGRQERNSLRGSVNGGGPRLVLRTSGGGIRVRSL